MPVAESHLQIIMSPLFERLGQGSHQTVESSDSLKAERLPQCYRRFVGPKDEIEIG